MNDAGHWAQVYDASWRLVFATDEVRLTYGDTGAGTVLPMGFHLFSAETTRFRVSVNRGGFALPEVRRARFLEIGPYILASTPGGREELRRVVDPEFADLVDQLEPKDLPPVWSRPGLSATVSGLEVVSLTTHVRIDDAHGNLAGVCNLIKPSAGMSQLAASVSTVDLFHLERMRLVEHADRRPAAILMADLEASSPLACRLSTARYFAFVRGWIRRGPLRRRCRWHCRPPRRRRRRRLLPRRNGRLRIRGGEIEHRRGAYPSRRAHGYRRGRRDPFIRAVATVRAPLGCDPVHRANPHRWSQRSHRPRRRSERGGADRSLRHRRPDTCL